MPRGSGEYQRISPASTAIGNQPLAYADTSRSDGIMPRYRRTRTPHSPRSSSARATSASAPPARGRLDDGEIDCVLLRVEHDFVGGWTGAQHDLDAEPLLVLDRDQAGEPFARFVFHRLVEFGSRSALISAVHPADSGSSIVKTTCSRAPNDSAS